MADSKKYNGSTWEHSLRKLTTATDTLTTLPADLYADGNSATVGLVGNMVQTGTPTPQNPIQPSECGDLETTGEHTGQYKIPISSASTTTPVYLGEVETTRKIKKLVLTGEESWRLQSINNYGIANFYINFSDSPLSTHGLCSHLEEQTTTIANTTTEGFLISVPSTLYLRIDSTRVDTATAFKAYLTDQYSAGTPVCVWYILATETTGIVNEPIRKIGTYADTVSGITIPTITGADSFDVLTTLKPSEVSLAYTGWHDATVKEWDGSEWQ